METISFETLPQAVSELSQKIDNLVRLTLEKSNEQKPEADQPLTIQQAADFLKLSVPTLYGKVHNASIPVCKQGKRLYFSKQGLIDWILSGRRKTLSEIEAETDQYLIKRKRR